MGLAEAIRKGRIRRADALMAAWDLLDVDGPRLNAVVHRFDPPVEDPQAGASRLAGIPFFLKDELDLRGHPLTLGSRLLQGHRPNATHPVVGRMLAAGLTVLGRTNMSELGLMPTTEPVAYGPTRNPWDLRRSPGGSSGGSAAAVAAGWVPIAHAADGGGSIRIPASACGLVGLKPTRGLHPQGPADPPQGFVVHGCVSRTVRDTAAFLDLIQQPPDGPPDPRRRPLRLRNHFASLSPEPLRPLRIGWSAVGLWGERCHPDVAASLSQTVQALRDLGHRVEPVDPPWGGARFARAFRVLWSAGAGVFLKVVRTNLQARLPRWGRRALGHDAVFRSAVRWSGRVEPFTARLAAFEEGASPSDLWLAELEFREASEGMRAWFADRDLWLTPTLMQPPVPIGALQLGSDPEEIERALLGYVGWTPLANATGIPAISVPAPASPDGIPIGMHFAAAWGREDLLLAVAAQLERVQPWPRLAPAPP